MYSQKSTAGNPTRHMIEEGEISAHDIYFIASRKVPYFHTLIFSPQSTFRTHHKLSEIYRRLSAPRTLRPVLRPIASVQTISTPRDELLMSFLAH